MRKQNNMGGFTLIEILIAISLAGALSVVMLNMSKQQSVIQKRAETSIEITTLHRSIEMILLNADSCKATLPSNVDISHPGIEINDIINITKSYPLPPPNPPTFVPTVAFSKGTTYGDVVKIQKIRIDDVNKNIPPMAPATPTATKKFGIINVIITYEKLSSILKSSSTATNTVQELRVPLSLELDGNNRVLNCYSQTGMAVETSKDEACKSLGGVLDPGANQCILVEFNPGSPPAPPPGPFTKYEAVSTEYLENFTNIFVKKGGDTMTGNLNIHNAGLKLVGSGISLVNGDFAQVSGNFTQVHGNITTSGYMTSSDKRLKKNIKNLNKISDKIFELKGVQFNWKNNGEKDYGFIAQDVEKIFPALVKTNPDTGMKAVKYTNLIPLILEELRVLKDQNKLLQKDNAIYKDEIRKIKEQLRESK